VAKRAARSVSPAASQGLIRAMSSCVGARSDHQRDTPATTDGSATGSNGRASLAMLEIDVGSADITLIENVFACADHVDATSSIGASCAFSAHVGLQKMPANLIIYPLRRSQIFAHSRAGLRSAFDL